MKSSLNNVNYVKLWGGEVILSLFLGIFLFSCNEKEDDNTAAVAGAAVLANQSAVATTATTQVTGTLTDSTGSALSKATLSVAESTSSSVQIKATVDTKVTTDDSGKFVIKVKIGKFTIKITKSDGTDLGSFTIDIQSKSGTPTVTLPTDAKFGIPNIYNAEISSDGTVQKVKICVDFPEKWGPSGSEYTCSVSGLVYTCVSSSPSNTVKATFPSIESAKVSLIDSPYIYGGFNLGFRGTKIEVNSVVANSYTLDSLNRVTSSINIYNNVTTNYTYSNYDQYGYPQSLTTGSQTVPLVYTYPGGSKPTKIVMGGGEYEYTNGILTYWTNGMGVAKTFTTSGTVQMCEEK